MKIRNSDLLFVHSQHDSLDDAIASSTGEYVHVAIVIDANTVIHATSHLGVAIQTLSEFLEAFEHADVYRPTIKNLDGVVARAKQFDKRPYNFSFYPDDFGFYCSQLVAIAFADVLMIEEQPMQFGDGKQVISDFWQNYYAKLGVAVPLNKPGTNPSQLAKLDEFQFIGVL
ncbi:YiiX/YebB-like N1pC/P60 family cysteine hydrolase [Leuconostoc rapi]|uniref:YiiX/YebB-like N1pC/P60 family cysteine hydrolase n=1 Tax=Leuconostoc rapi TaxID=1406906 RepID=UPI00195D11C4|nr:YiiX/YebB-like N1pC/P60 family cysteine hydrolase [Leuconostoc rapi]MBM7435454.1 cell wall-associated NlpC family hydrolase [Leuconostoc rapi]